MEFSAESIKLEDAPSGTIGVSELDYDLGIKDAPLYVVVEHRGLRTLVVKMERLTAKREMMDLPSSMKICPQL